MPSQYLLALAHHRRVVANSRFALSARIGHCKKVASLVTGGNLTHHPPWATLTCYSAQCARLLFVAFLFFGEKNPKNIEMFFVFLCFLSSFFVCKHQTEWILLARSKTEMEDWMDAINDQIHALFIRQYNVPEDDYWSQGWVNHALPAVI